MSLPSIAYVLYFVPDLGSGLSFTKPAKKSKVTVLYSFDLLQVV